MDKGAAAFLARIRKLGSVSPDAFGPTPPHPRVKGGPSFRPTPSGQLRLARGLRDRLRPTRPLRGGLSHAQGIRTGLCLARRSRTNLAPFDVQRLVSSYLIASLLFPHDDGYRARQDFGSTMASRTIPCAPVGKVLPVNDWTVL